jgi:GNAT superfamily N-acetyltransferase
MSAPAPAANFKIRAAHAEDSAVLARLSAQLGYPATPDQVSARLNEVLRDPSGAIFVAETSSGEVAGFIHLLHQSLIETDMRTEVAALVVDEVVRGSGVGRAQMARAEEWAREHGCHNINLRSNVIRAGAHYFYERIGYRHYKTQKAFRKDL